MPIRVQPSTKMERPKLLPDRPDLTLISEIPPKSALYQYHPAFGLTPPRLVASYRQAELGYPQWQCDIFDDIVESDAHLRSQLESRLEAVAGKPWIIQAGGEDPADVNAAKLLEEALRRVPNFYQTVAHQLKGAWYGYAYSEIAWAPGDGGLIVPTWFSNAPMRRFQFGDYNEPLLVTEDNPDGEPLLPGKWWCSVSSAHFDPARAGLMRTASWWSLFKRQVVRDWIVFADRFGLPYVTGEYDSATASEEDKKVLALAIQQLGSDGSAMFSKACGITVHTVHDGGKSSDVHGAITSLCNAEISKLITGATLTTETAGPGSFALGKVHADAAFALRAADAEKLGHSFEVFVGGPFCAYNRIKARPPRLKINITPDLDPLTRAQVASIMCNDLGMDLDEEQMRQETNLKKPASDKNALKGKRVAAPDPVKIGIGAGN